VKKKTNAGPRRDASRELDRAIDRLRGLKGSELARTLPHVITELSGKSPAREGGSRG
jgi:hypothetical protein